MAEFYPLVSIIIPAYNRVDLIKDTLESIKNQTYTYWEAIVVDDHSTDGTYALVESIAESEKRIRLFKRDREPKGAPTCRNIGLEKSCGDYIIFLDSDDLLAAFCLERRVASFAKFPANDFLVFQSFLFENKPGDNDKLWNIDTKENDLTRFLRIDALWPICGPIYKKEVFSKLGVFREGLPFYQDFDLHLRLLLSGYKYLRFLDTEPDCFIRHHFNNSVSNSIPFTSDTEILQHRIDFYLYQLQFIRQHKIKLTKIQFETIWSILFYFCNRYLIEHNKLKLYYKNWAKAGRLLPLSTFQHMVTFMVPVLTSLQKRSKYFIKFKSLYTSLFKKYIADENLIFNSSLYKINNDQLNGPK